MSKRKSRLVIYDSDDSDNELFLQSIYDNNNNEKTKITKKKTYLGQQINIYIGLSVMLLKRKTIV